MSLLRIGLTGVIVALLRTLRNIRQVFIRISFIVT